MTDYLKFDLDDPRFANFESDGMVEDLDPTDGTAGFRQWLAEIPMLTPAEIVAALRKLGYRGQDRAARAVALAAHRHLRRIRAIHLDGVPRQELPAKNNLLLVGPTGCGKTYLAELLFREVLTIPTTTVDITSFSESGYIGEDTNTLVTRLLYAAGGDLYKTSVGMICLDEFDKLASSSNRAVFAGQGTTKDVSGFGVQRELLKLLESSTISVPTQFGHEAYDDKPLVSTADIAFIAAGAFSGLKAVCEQARAGGIGFGRNEGNDNAGSAGDIAVRYQQNELDDIGHFQEYGFLPELIARFARVVPFEPLSRETLASILNDNVIRGYRRELEMAGCQLEIDDAVMDRVVDQALSRQTGARGLRNGMVLHLEDSAYQVYSSSGAKRLLMRLVDGEIRAEVETSKGPSRRRPARTAKKRA